MSSMFGYYWDLSREMFKNRVTVDLFACTHAAVDLPYITPICYDTGGDVYYYKAFNERYDYDRMMYDVFRILT